MKQNGKMINLFKIVVCMTAGAQKREWDIDKYVETMRRISRKNGILWILIGSGVQAERYAAHVVDRLGGISVVNLVNRTSLRQTEAVLKQSDMYFGGDTGPMHMAVAAGISGVVLSCHPIGAAQEHANAPERFGPWQSSMEVLRPEPLPGCENGCAKEYAHCINQIRVDDVVKSMATIISKHTHQESYRCG